MNWDIKRPKETKCPICGHDTLELYDEANRPMKYKTMLRVNRDDKERIGRMFYEYPLSHFRCNTCKRCFGICWVLGYPIPYY